MGGKKLVYCCIIGILIGFLAPFVFKTDRHATLMWGMVGGLAIGYLLDVRDGKKDAERGQASLGKKADRANKLLERAKRGLEDESLRMDDEEKELYESDTADEDIPDDEDGDELAEVVDYEAEAEKRAEKLKRAEDLLREARMQIGEVSEAPEEDEKSAKDEYDSEEAGPSADDEYDAEAEKLKKAEELLRKARERMK